MVSAHDTCTYAHIHICITGPEVNWAVKSALSETSALLRDILQWEYEEAVSSTALGLRYRVHPNI